MPSCSENHVPGYNERVSIGVLGMCTASALQNTTTELRSRKLVSIVIHHDTTHSRTGSDRQEALLVETAHTPCDARHSSLTVTVEADISSSLIYSILSFTILDGSRIPVTNMTNKAGRLMFHCPLF